MHIVPHIGRLLLAGYILCFAFFNLVAYLISSFYQKKFNQPSPRTGFLVAIALGALYAVSQFVPGTGGMAAAAKVILLFGASGTSAWSAATLYFTMKRRK